MSEDWRTEVDAPTYFGQRKRRQDIDGRRPVIRQASDLVGPGIAAGAIRVTSWNDTLATFNGFFSSTPGAIGAPNSTDTFIGHVSMDEALGGKQVATSLGGNTTYSRIFIRNPTDPNSITFGLWKNESEVGPSADTLRPIGEMTMWWGNTNQVPSGWLLCTGGSYNTSIYPKLFAHLGSNQLPNMYNRFPLDAGLYGHGVQGGAPWQDITLPDHRHSIAGQTGARTDQNRASGSAAGVLTLVSDYQNHNHGGWSGMGGGRTFTVDTMPPWTTVYFMIRAGVPGS